MQFETISSVHKSYKSSLEQCEAIILHWMHWGLLRFSKCAQLAEFQWWVALDVTYIL